MASTAAVVPKLEVQQHVDVLIVGAGVSGIGGACHLRRQCPEKSFTILEGRENLGGTWDLFKFPGIRSDSDLYTYGYRFKPWQGKPIATAQEIKNYLKETVAEYDIEQSIQFGHHVDTVEWSSEDALWYVYAHEVATDKPLLFTCGFLWMCQGYFNYEEGYRPEFPGEDRFGGEIVHPQHWPEDLDYKGKKVVVVGSGATAVTLIPAMAAEVESLVMLQRSPSYIFSMPNTSPLQELLSDLDLPDDWVHEIVRRRNLKDGENIALMAKHQPEVLRDQLLEAVREAMPDVDIDTHFTPRYMPWEERLCLVPDGDLFHAINRGNVDVVTDHIKTFSEDGIVLESGKELEADIVVAATGIQLCPLGNIDFVIDGETLDIPKSWAYRGMMLSDVPNMAWTFGYIRTSWTMRADMVSDFVCRLLQEMDATGTRQVTPRLRQEDQQMERRGYIDAEDFSPGYMARSMHTFPSQGDREPWINSQDYYQEAKSLPEADLGDGTLIFDNPAKRAASK